MSKKGENIYKRKDGRWEGRYIKGHAPDGTAQYGYCYGRTYRDVRQTVTAARAALLTNATVNGRSKRLSVYCDEWLQLKRSRVKTSTYVKYLTTVENHIKPQLGSCLASALSALQVEQFGYDLMHIAGLSAKTVKDILAILHSILLYVGKEVPNLRPIEIVYPKTDKKEMRVLTRDEQDRLIRYLTQQTDLCKFGTLFTLLTGLRLGEVCALRWRDISEEDGLVRVSATMQRIKDLENTGAKTKIVISEPKSASSARVIPLSAFAMELCRQFRSAPEAFILTGESGHYLEPRVMQYHMERYAAACGLTGVHFHTLRHSFATRCVEVGFEIKSLSEVLGHASPQITLDRYVHSSLELKRENMNKLAALGY